ncbi:helix-turn-helix domain-containing protein [Campylobacter concisus]
MDLLHIRACEILGISRQELADKLGISVATINSWTSDPARISQTTKLALELMIENHKLKMIVKKAKEAQEAITNFRE